VNRTHSVGWHSSAVFAGLVVAASSVLVLGAADAQAVVVGRSSGVADPSGRSGWATAELPLAARAPPPADQIADPVTPAAVCGGWYLQHNYGDRWPAVPLSHRST
jgi:hypothetical protein